MRKHEKDGVVYFTFESFDETNIVKHCFSSRIGGVSKGAFSSMNLSFTRGDILENVTENFNRLCNAVGFLPKNLIFSDQVHETAVLQVTKNDAGKGFSCSSNIHRIDGLMTDEPDLVLTTFYADCIPLYFLDADNHAIALSHAGWRGTLNNIARVTIQSMQKTFGSDPKRIKAAIGPSIGVCCFETASDVAELFFEKMPSSVSCITKGKKEGKYQIDLWTINKENMLCAGIKNDNIEMAGICTMCNPDLFYSHRLTGTNRGSMAAFMSLR